MRIALVATLTFAAGLLLGSTLLSSPTAPPAGLLEGSSEGGGSGTTPAIAPHLATRSPGDDAPAGEAADAMTDGPRLEAAGAAGRARQGGPGRGWTLKRLNEGYAYYRAKEGASIPAELQDAATTAALDHVNTSIHNYAGWIRGYVDRQQALGTFGDPPRIVLEARGSGNVSAVDWPKQIAARAKVSHRPLDLGTLPESSTGLEVYRETGVPELGRAFVLERVDVVALLGREDASDGRRTSDRLRVWVGRSEALNRGGGSGRRIQGSLEGLHVVTPPSGRLDLRISVHDAAVGLSAVGRYVTLEEASKLRSVPFRFVEEGDDGLLGDEPVTLQILADHGGGNQRLVRLDGTTNHRVDSMAEADLWDASRDLRALPRSMAWTENAGVVPPGKVFRVSRIDWRARLDPQKTSHSDFIIRFAGKDLVEHKAPDGTEISGTWEGELDVRPGEAKRFEVKCSYFGMGEAVVSGSLIDTPK